MVLHCPWTCRRLSPKPIPRRRARAPISDSMTPFLDHSQHTFRTWVLPIGTINKDMTFKSCGKYPWLLFGVDVLKSKFRPPAVRTNQHQAYMLWAATIGPAKSANTRAFTLPACRWRTPPKDQSSEVQSSRTRCTLRSTSSSASSRRRPGGPYETGRVCEPADMNLRTDSAAVPSAPHVHSGILQTVLSNLQE
ncbi:hypothetical protein FHX06_007156 [Rhizobium sp. BK512]|nr:hypothetical protein [Rhizobium sp. BK512]